MRRRVVVPSHLSRERMLVAARLAAVAVIPPPGSQLAAVYLDVRPDGWERGTLREVSAIARTAGWTEDELEEFYEERDAKGVKS